MTDEMRVLVLDEHHPDLRDAIGSLRLDVRPVPSPRAGEVLVKVAAAPCHPSDLMFLQGRYGVKKTLPTVPGSEGAGTVVASGGGLLGRWLAGKRVACAVRDDVDGTWGEYCVVRADTCVPLPKGIDFAQGATSLANPLTACVMIDMIRAAKHRAIVQTAANSQLGQILRRLAAEAGIPMVNIVRRSAQADELRASGEAHVLCSSDPDFEAALREVATRLGATIALDAVGGDLTGLLARALPDGATIVIYGSLSERPCGDIEPIDFIFTHKRLVGFEVAQHLEAQGLFRVLPIVRRAQRLMTSGAITTTVQRSVVLDEAREGLLHYVDHMSDGKILIAP